MEKKILVWEKEKEVQLIRTSCEERCTGGGELTFS